MSNQEELRQHPCSDLSQLRAGVDAALTQIQSAGLNCYAGTPDYWQGHLRTMEDLLVEVQEQARLIARQQQAIREGREEEV